VEPLVSVARARADVRQAPDRRGVGSDGQSGGGEALNALALKAAADHDDERDCQGRDRFRLPTASEVATCTHQHVIIIDRGAVAEGAIDLVADVRVHVGYTESECCRLS